MTTPDPGLSARERHWASNRRLTIALLAVWLAVTIGVIWFADALNQWNLVGPMGYYMAAQGALLIYLLIIGYYAYRMKQLDARSGLDGGGGEK